MLLNYENTHRIALAVDCVILGFEQTELKLLLVKRNFEPELGKWSLMGGFLHENENLEQASKRILLELTGLKDIYMEQLFTYSQINRDPVERTISVCYFALINIQQDNEPKLNANAQWISLKNTPNLIFDHDQMVDNALKTLKNKASKHPIGFELMPEKFTIPQLQKLYEAIYDSKIDRRNFSKTILATKLLIDTGEKDSNSVTKKATVYQLDKEKYLKFQH
jgi:8-oxo-dGTP diphosphatase